MKIKHLLSNITLVLIGSVFLSSCVPMDNNGGYNNGAYNGGYGNPYYGGPGNYNSGYPGNPAWGYNRERDRLHAERERLRDERRRLEDDRESMREAEEARRRQEEARKNDRCPSGFYRTEKRCSKEERRRGCQDLKSPGGNACLRNGF